MSGDSTAYCLQCLEEIPAKRLAAMPNARYCRDCQEVIGVPSYVPTHALAIGGEGDDQTRMREEGWSDTSRRSVTHLQPCEFPEVA